MPESKLKTIIDIIIIVIFSSVMIGAVVSACIYAGDCICPTKEQNNVPSKLHR